MKIEMKNWVSEILKLYNLDKQFADQQVLLVWSEIVGTNLAKLTRAIRFSHGTLTVETSSNTVSQELSLMEKRYVMLLNQRMERQLVLKIRFVPGNFSSRKIAGPDKPEGSVNEDELALSDLDDPHLRDSFAHLYKTQRRREEAMLKAGAHRCPRCGVVFFGEEKLCPGCRYDQIDDT
jgi:predicted Zn-ribbon and HTH transcriptional regulator